MYPLLSPFGVVQDNKVYMHSGLQHLLHVCLLCLSCVSGVSGVSHPVLVTSNILV